MLLWTNHHQHGSFWVFLLFCIKHGNILKKNAKSFTKISILQTTGASVRCASSTTVWIEPDHFTQNMSCSTTKEFWFLGSRVLLYSFPYRGFTLRFVNLSNVFFKKEKHSESRFLTGGGHIFSNGIWIWFCCPIKTDTKIRSALFCFWIPA